MVGRPIRACWSRSSATLGSLPLGILCGHVLARRSFPGRSLVETVLNLPLVVPPVVTGYLLLVLFGRKGWIGSYLDTWFGFSLAFTWKGAALASAVMAFPLMVRAIHLSVAEVDSRLEQAARTLGAGPVDVFLTVTLPLARRGIIAGAVLAFARSIGEFGATIMFAGNIPGETRTIPLEIYSDLSTPGGVQQGGRLVVASLLIAATALVGANYLERRARWHKGGTR